MEEKQKQKQETTATTETTSTEEPSTTSGSELIRDVDPNSEEHRDAGQVQQETFREAQDELEERERARSQEGKDS